MPNHILNEVEVAAGRDYVLPLVTNKEGQIDFATLLPLPINYWPGNVGSEHKETFPGTHLDAARATWGTKWNAYGINRRYQSIVADRERTLLTFQTAWSPPMGWIMALWNTTKAAIVLRWLDEGRSEAVIDRFDYAILAGDGFGEPWTRTAADEAETRRLHKLLWGVESFDDEGAE